jgi:photosystem II stability/assembly factor-like uncharacterized protein
MPGHGRPVWLIVCLVWSACFLPAAYCTEPTPREDDANLRDVHFVGTKAGWVVGDQGVIWHTDDGGQHWSLQNSPVKCPLYSVCFLTDRIGWIVGGGFTPYTRIGYGVVLFTQDGGESWTIISDAAKRQATQKSLVSNQTASTLPPLTFVKFFGMDDGVAVGESSVEFPTGVLFTRDSGKTWQSVAGNQELGWRAADFLDRRTGVTAGLRGKVSLVGYGQLLPPRIGDLGLRGLWDLKLDPDRSGWLVGDGGLVMRTNNAGIVWQSPPTLLPKDLRDSTDFRAVAKHNDKAWIAGVPGSIIWHTPDDGRSWTKQRTGQPLPVFALHFSTDKLGWAVGAMGLILQTVDGGQTWTTMRGKDRRAATMAIHSHAGRVSFHLMAMQSGEQGYRSVVLLPLRRDVGAIGHSQRDLDLRLSDAVTTAGGSAAMIDWRLPVTVPGLDRNSERLLDDWNQRTEGRLKLVAQLRTWRPSILILDEPSEDDAATRLLNEAVMQSVKQAADPTFFIHHNELAGLEAWQVEKVYQRLPAESSGHAMIDLHAYLPRLQKSVQLAASPAYGKLAALPPQTVKREAYRLVFDQMQKIESRIRNRDFFSSIPLQPGSAARRRLPAIDPEKLERQLEIARKQKHFQAIAERAVDDQRRGAQLVASLRPLTKGMSPDQAAVQLMQLAKNYQRRASWDLMEATLMELVNRYPDEPAAWDGMRWLLQLWTGTETAYQRAKKIQVIQKRTRYNPTNLIERINATTRQAPLEPNQIELLQLNRNADPIEFALREGLLKTGPESDWRSGTVRGWHDRALRMASLIRRKNTQLFQSPEVQFPLASLLRQRGAHTLADRFYRRFRGGGMDDPWRMTALSEIQLTGSIRFTQKNVTVCKSTSKRPVLDGVFGDDCWQNANVLWLTDSQQNAKRVSKRINEAGEPQIRNEIPEGQQNLAFAMLAYDREYLYLALSVPRHPDAPVDRPVSAGRTHDADLSNFDRVGLFLDVDRDYVTYYSMQVDQRGLTADACWNDSAWNPKWFVKAEADAVRWRIEAAIPFKELVPAGPVPGDVWAAGIVRTIPAVKLESWTHPASSEPRPESFGLIRFQ